MRTTVRARLQLGAIEQAEEPVLGPLRVAIDADLRGFSNDDMTRFVGWMEWQSQQRIQAVLTDFLVINQVEAAADVLAQARAPKSHQHRTTLLLLQSNLVGIPQGRHLIEQTATQLVSENRLALAAEAEVHHTLAEEAGKDNTLTPGHEAIFRLAPRIEQGFVISDEQMK
ncbi:hypothetical protein MMC09_000512 [Bachmanniomyces sp. S44760]|nr:hypothetical protein [Bachmanniomyces sp. S44760]